jgi:ribonuclease Z
MDLSIFFAGTGGSVPNARRGLPALLLSRGSDRILFDCGEGTQRQLVRSVGLPDLHAVFLTHFHADHWLGLPGMLKTFDLRGRQIPLSVYGPPGLGELIGSLRRVYGRPAYELNLVELEPGEAVEYEDCAITPFAVEHRTSAYGYAIAEAERRGRFDEARGRELGIEPGPVVGRLLAGETVEGVSPEQVIGPPRPGRSVVISGDTAPCDAVVDAARGADLLIHEATFADEESDRARQTSHSTAGGAARVAAEAEVGLLALVHLSSRYGTRQLRDEARAGFPNTVVPRDFDTIEIPFAERGEPRLVRFEEIAPA